MFTYDPSDSELALVSFLADEAQVDTTEMWNRLCFSMLSQIFSTRYSEASNRLVNEAAEAIQNGEVFAVQLNAAGFPERI